MATTATTKPKPKAAAEPQATTPQRNSIAEWAITILILLFGTSTIAQPFVIPTSSMHNTHCSLATTDVDKLAYAPPGPLSKHLLPYEDVQRGDTYRLSPPTQITVDYVR